MTLVFNKLRKVLNEQFSFHFDQLELETKFELELGMDSREMLELFMELEMIFEIEINFDSIDVLIKEEKFITIQDLVQYIENQLSRGWTLRLVNMCSVHVDQLEN